MSRRSSRSCADGLTVVELLVALALGLAVSAIALTLSLAGRRIYETDRARTRLNQNMRASMDFLKADIRQAGERLGDDFPALLIVNGSGSDPDRIVTRRNLVDTVLRVCSDTDAHDETIAIAQAVGPPLGCAVVADDDGDGWPENLEDWHAFRLAGGGTARAYIYNPVTKQGEFFDYVDDDEVAWTISAASGIEWQFDYPVDERCRLYLLEERSYELSDEMLQITLNADADRPLRLAQGIGDFQTIAIMQDFSQLDSLDVNGVWSDLRSIEITLEGSISVRQRVVERTWTNEIMPRNILSR